MAATVVVVYQFGDDVAELVLRDDLVFVFLGIAIFVLPVFGLLYAAWRDGQGLNLEPTPRVRSRAFNGFTAGLFLLTMLAFALGCLFLLVQFVRWSWEFGA